MHAPDADPQAAGNQYANWVSEFLPDDLPSTAHKDTRIFFYKYESYWNRDAVKTRLWDLGVIHLSLLQEARPHSKCMRWFN
jgi:hypothetical protein